MDIEMRIRGLLMDPTTNSPIVILKDISSDAMLPIWVGHFEASAIANEIEKVVPQRPMTHDLLKQIIQQFGASVDRIIITELKDNTFFAVIVLDQDGKSVLIDARPSDAIALALRADCPIFVRDQVIQSSKETEIDSLSEISGFEDEEDEEVDWPDELGDLTDYKM